MQTKEKKRKKRNVEHEWSPAYRVKTFHQNSIFTQISVQILKFFTANFISNLILKLCFRHIFSYVLFPKFADLSGSERVSKTGFEKASTGGFEGILINYELTQFGITIDNMVQQHLKNRRSKTSKQPAKNSDSMLARLLSGIIGGKAIACMIVCLSQSDNNGNESYCSLRFGERLAKLSVPFPETEKWFDMKKKLASLNKELKEQEDALKKIDSTGWFCRNVTTIAKTKKNTLEPVEPKLMDLRAGRQVLKILIFSQKSTKTTKCWRGRGSQPLNKICLKNQPVQTMG